MKGVVLTLIAGVAAAVAMTASPLTVAALPLAWAAITLAGRGLPDHERRTLTALLWCALAARIIVIAALFVMALPAHSDVSVGGLGGDDAYYLDRAIRARDLLMGFAAGKYDFFVVNDTYGRTSYLSLLTWLQVFAGPTPYGMRVVNAAMFVTGSAILFRTVRKGFGSVPAFAGLAVLLFLPSLFFWSVSLLKESMFFLLTAMLIGAAMRLADEWRSPSAIALVLVIAGSLFVLDDLRRGALVLAVAGLGLGVIMRVLFARPVTIVLTAVVIASVLTAAATSATVRAKFVSGVTSAAQIQAGNVFTIGHAYKLLDDGFYMFPGVPEGLTFDQAVRFVARAARSFIVTPWPWEMRSLGELAFLPEHLLWYVMIIFAPIGFVAGWKRDPLLACVLLGYAIPTAATLAVTNGNVGTLLRLRGLVTPQLVWLAAIGVVAVIAALTQPSRAPHLAALATEGPRS